MRDEARLVRRKRRMKRLIYHLGKFRFHPEGIRSHCSTWHKAVTKTFLCVEDGLKVSLA